MHLTQEDYRYLKGELFSNGYNFALENNVAKDRLNTIIDLVRGKRVVHVGCCDHIPLIKDKISHGTWLHGILRDNCKEVVGIDINRKAVDYLKAEGLGEGVYCSNILSDPPLKCVENFDYILLGEIVEHLDNPVWFLQAVREKYHERVQKCIITAPNAFSATHIKRLRQKIEGINSDHRFWFTPYTLCKIMMVSGIKPEEVLFADNMDFIYRLYRKFFGKLIPHNSIRGGTLLAVGNLEEMND